MKINLIPSVFAIAISALLGYLCYEFSDNSFKSVYTGFAFISSLVPILFFIAIEFPSNRTTINIKALSFVDLLFSLVLMFIFNNSGSNQQAFIISFSFLIIIYLGIIYMISQMSK